jgi:hypothetical protein
LSTKVERQIQWRRSKVAELDSQGHSQPEMASILQVSIGTVNRDLSYLRQQAKSNVKRYIDEKLPEEYEKCLVGLTAILREAWNTSQQTEDRREKIQALSLAKECYSMKLDLLTNATVVDDAIRFVSEKGAAANANAETKTNAPVVTEDEQQQQKEQEEDNITTDQQQQQQQQHSTTTINQVF